MHSKLIYLKDVNLKEEELKEWLNNRGWEELEIEYQKDVETTLDMIIGGDEVVELMDVDDEHEAMFKTAIENKQNLIVEGCYIPFDWEKDFSREYLDSIQYYCLIMSENYVRNHFVDIKKNANIIENRLDDEGCTMDSVLADNVHTLNLAKKHEVNYILIDDKYEVDIEL